MSQYCNWRVGRISGSASVLFQVSQHIMWAAYVRCEPDQWQTWRRWKTADETIWLPSEWAPSQPTSGQLLLQGLVHSYRTQAWTGKWARRGCCIWEQDSQLSSNVIFLETESGLQWESGVFPSRFSHTQNLPFEYWCISIKMVWQNIKKDESTKVK